MKLLRRLSILTLVLLLGFAFGSWRMSLARQHFSPCPESLLCLWNSELSFDGSIRLTTHTALSIDNNKLPNLIGAIDALHGAMLAQGEEFEDDTFADPEDLENQDGISLENEERFQQILNTTWNSGAIVARGTLALDTKPLNQIPLALGQFFLRDTDYLNSFIATHFPAINDTFADFPFSELSNRENMPAGVHQYLAQIAVFDLFAMYENLCDNNTATPLCDWLDTNGYGPLPLLETVEYLAGSDAVLHVNVYWSVRNGQILWANTLDALTNESAWRASPHQETLEQWPSFNTSSKTKGFSTNPTALWKLWQSVLDTANNLASSDHEWQGFLAFPDLNERLASLTDAMANLPKEPEFLLSVTTGDNLFSAQLLFRSSESAQLSQTLPLPPEALLSQWLLMLIPEQPNPAAPNFRATTLPSPLKEWQKLTWETPFSALPLQTLRRLADATSGLPEAFD